MWIDAGFAPDEFWTQTPHSFQLTMQGVRKRMEREAEARLTQSWEAAAMTGAAMSGKLKPLRHYLGNRSRKRQTPREMLDVLRMFQAAGANMTIRQIKRD
jgi:hypothetical protein